MLVKGKKLKMTQIFTNDEAVGVTPIELADKAEISGFGVGDSVKVTGKTKGKGFQGVVKRHGFSGGPKTHGQKNRHRAPGSIGNTSPQRTLPGRRMAGRMGGVKRSIKNLEIVQIDADKKILMLRGAVPGNRSAKVLISKS